MDRLQIIDSGVAQLTKEHKANLLGVHLGAGLANDQDRYVYDVEKGVFAVADGVGGEENGDRAAEVACAAFHDECLAEDRLAITDEASLLLAQTSLLQIIHAAAQKTRGYSTFTGLYRTDENHVAYLHAGDSSLVLRREDQLHYVTSLHHPLHHTSQLLNYVGGDYEADPKRMAPQAGGRFESLTEWGLLQLQDGDQLMLVTDGVTSLSGGRELTDAQWKRAMYKRNKQKRALGAQAITKRLVRVSDRPDDATAIVIRFGLTETV